MVNWNAKSFVCKCEGGKILKQWTKNKQIISIFLLKKSQNIKSNKTKVNISFVLISDVVLESISILFTKVSHGETSYSLT